MDIHIGLLTIVGIVGNVAIVNIHVHTRAYLIE